METRYHLVTEHHLTQKAAVTCNLPLLRSPYQPLVTPPCDISDMIEWHHFCWTLCRCEVTWSRHKPEHHAAEEKQPRHQTFRASQPLLSKVSSTSNPQCATQRCSQDPQSEDITSCTKERSSVFSFVYPLFSIPGWTTNILYSTLLVRFDTCTIRSASLTSSLVASSSNHIKTPSHYPFLSQSSAHSYSHLHSYTKLKK